ncbi:hypothetical protein FRC08_005737 [Ceratobasidium sp. 394]|nr:hypothetical protein FRC08_005737 [Ceratobasidium sp. 394]
MEPANNRSESALLDSPGHSRQPSEDSCHSPFSNSSVHAPLSPLNQNSDGYDYLDTIMEDIPGASSRSESPAPALSPATSHPSNISSSGDAYTGEIPLFDVVNLLQRSGNPRLQRELTLPPIEPDNSNQFAPPDPLSWVENDPFTMDWEPLDVDLGPELPDAEYYEDILDQRDVSEPPEPEHLDFDEELGDLEALEGLGEAGDLPSEEDEPDNNQNLESEDDEPLPDLGGEPDDPGAEDDVEDDAEGEIPRLLRNIYIRAWIDSTFGGATQEQTTRTLFSHKSTLEDHAEAGALAEALPTMALTFRSLERQLGVNADEYLQIFALCKACGTRYSEEEVNEAPYPGCPYIRPGAEEPCGYPIWEERELFGGAKKRVPFRSFPYFPIQLALKRILARPGMRELLMRHVRDDEDIQPATKQDWLDSMPLDQRFSDISQAWGWSSEPAKLQRDFNEEDGVYGDAPGEDSLVSLASLPLGLSVNINYDGYVLFSCFTRILPVNSSSIGLIHSLAVATVPLAPTLPSTTCRFTSVRSLRTRYLFLFFQGRVSQPHTNLIRSLSHSSTICWS